MQSKYRFANKLKKKTERRAQNFKILLRPILKVSFLPYAQKSLG